MQLLISLVRMLVWRWIIYDVCMMVIWRSP